MNSPATILVPAPRAEISASVEVASFEERHQRMIVASADLNEALLEDLTTEGMDYIKGLIGQIGADLTYCRRTAAQAEDTST